MCIAIMVLDVAYVSMAMQFGVRDPGALSGTR